MTTELTPLHLPPRLSPGDEIRVLALSRSLGGAMQYPGFTQADVEFATDRLQALGLKVSFGAHVGECNAHLTASPQHRLEDLHKALATPSVKAILAVTGGISAIQLLEGIDYQLLAAHPKILCGYSDIAYLCNAFVAQAHVVTYYGPNFTSFMMRQGAEYTLRHFRECLFTHSALVVQPAEAWSDDAWHQDQQNRTFHPNDGLWPIQEGEAEGTILGGSYWCLNMLQGSAYFPPLQEAILFLEHPTEGKATLMNLDSGLRALAFQPGFAQVRAIVLGRFAQKGGITREKLRALLHEIPALRRLPVIANCDFGHTTPVLTVPIGGRCQLQVAKDQASLTFTQH